MVKIGYLWLVVFLLVIGCGKKEKAEIIKERMQVGNATTQPIELIGKEEMEVEIQRAREYISSGMYREAIILLKELVEVDPENPTLYYLLGQAYEEDGQHELSVHAFIKALQLDPNIASKVEEGERFE